jgi:Plasmid encoded RepA protein
MESVGEILAKSPKLKKVAKAAGPLTRSHVKLLDAATDIRMNPGDTDAAFMARELVQCTLPHKNPGNNLPAWTRQNGNLTLSVKPGSDEAGRPYGYPYGIIPRLLLFWITTEAVRTKDRRLELGHSLACFMREVGLDPSTGRGKRGDAKRLQDQMERLFQATISFHQTMEEQHRHGKRWLNMQVAPKGEFWWNPHDPEQGTLWGSYVILGEDFFAAITSAPVPVDMRVLRAIKRSPLALDLYAWVTWRVFRLSKSAFVPWEGLMRQMGSEYACEKEFARHAKATLRKIRACYPALKLDFVKGGLLLHPSPPSIAPAPKRVILPQSATNCIFSQGFPR